MRYNARRSGQSRRLFDIAPTLNEPVSEETKRRMPGQNYILVFESHCTIPNPLEGPTTVFGYGEAHGKPTASLAPNRPGGQLGRLLLTCTTVRLENLEIS